GRAGGQPVGVCGGVDAGDGAGGAGRHARTAPAGPGRACERRVRRRRVGDGDRARRVGGPVVGGRDRVGDLTAGHDRRGGGGTRHRGGGPGDRGVGAGRRDRGGGGGGGVGGSGVGGAGRER